MDPFTIYPYSWHVDEDGYVHIFALDLDNNSVHIEIPDFTPYVYMELPNEIEWTELRKQSILSAIKDLPDEIQPVTKSFMIKRKLYYANVTKKANEYIYNKYPYLFLAFRKKQVMFEFIKKMQYGTYIPSLGKRIKFRFHEQDASPILQLTCCRKIPVTGWINGKGKLNIGNKNSSLCDFQYRISWGNLFPCKDETILKKLPKPKVMFFDLEANSANILTMPKNRPDDKIFQISLVVMRHGVCHDNGDSIFEKHLLSLGLPEKTKLGDDNIILHTYENEGDLLVGFKDLICSLNPQILGGYNIMGWDFDYLIKRAKYTGVYSEFIKFGVLRGVKAIEKKISWSSSAFNSQNFVLLDSPGRLIIDMLPIIRRDYKFERYDLGSVSSEILKRTKDPLTHKGIFKCYRIFSPQSLAIVGKYCVIDSLVTALLFDKTKTWIGSCQLSSIFSVPIIDLYTQGQQVKIYSQVYRYCHEYNVVVEKDVYKSDSSESYTGAIVLDPVVGFHENVYIVDFASLYPTIMISNNICYSTLVNNPDIPDEDCHVFDFWDHVGCEHDKTKRTTKVKNPVCVRRIYRFLKKPIGIVPTILTNLISERKKTKKSMEEVKGQYDEEKDISVKRELGMLVSVLDLRQNSLKTSTNSFYGGQGVHKGKLPLMAGAMCTTAGGRDGLTKAKGQIKDRVIYGDTDSLFCVPEDMSIFKMENGEVDYKKYKAYCEGVAEEISKLFPPPMKLEFETICKKFLLFTKKKYMGEQVNGKIKQRGILLNRRDNSSCCRTVYQGLIKLIFDYKSFEDAVYYLVQSLNDIYSHTFKTGEYAITKSIKEIDTYKVKPLDKDPTKREKQFKNKFLDPKKDSEIDYMIRSLPAHVQLAEKMRRRGAIVEAGSRISFIVTQTGGTKGKMWQKIESTEYYQSHSDVIRLDMSYYCKSLMNPIDQVLETKYKKSKFMKGQLALRLIKEEMLAELKDLFKLKITCD